jgi:hypothetical protein
MCCRTASVIFVAILASLLTAGCGRPGTDGGRKTTPVKAAQSAKSKQEAEAPHTKVTTAPRPVSDDELGQGFIALFDGQTLFGWRAESKADWRVEGDAIVVAEGEPGLLCTTAEFSDYVLRCEFQSAAGTNSGIFLHTPSKPTDPAKDCYELNIAGPDNPFPTGSLVKRVKAEAEVKPDEWHAFEVTVQGAQIRVQLDGKQVAEYTDPQPLKRGRIGLQLNSGRVAFRKIRLKPLGLAEMFNGRDLSGWKTYPDQPSRFTVTSEGWLNAKNGRGQLESEASYGDFVMQLDCITHAPQLNSGVFFRCIPGEFMNGYESQIHNGFRNGDRSQPVDCGTGGVFRRKNARLVAADDKQWFAETLIVNGPHVATWVNGYQVTDWTDERPPHDNPREGLRLKPGTIMLQGHDPTTDISFRNLRICELAVRPDLSN